MSGRPRLPILPILVALGIVALLFALPAFAHQRQGLMKHHDQSGSAFLYGHRIGSPHHSAEINCCKYGGPNGDCRKLDPASIKYVDGGVEVEGYFVPMSETSISPQNDDGTYDAWGCRYPQAAWHCLFLPPMTG